MWNKQWKQSCRFPHQTWMAMGLLAVFTAVFVWLLWQEHAAAALCGALPAMLGAVFFSFSDRTGFLRWTAIFLLIGLWCLGAVALPAPWAGILQFSGAAAILFAVTAWEFAEYYLTLNTNTLLPQKRRDLWEYLCYPVRRSDHGHPAESDEHSCIAMTGSGKPVQLIPGKRSLYIHYLKTDRMGTKILPDSRITDYGNIDECPKQRKDYRINYSSIKSASLYLTPLSEAPGDGQFPATGLLQLRLAKGQKQFYPADGLTEEKARRLFSSVRKLMLHTEIPSEGITIRDAVRSIDGKRKCWILLRSATWLFLALALCDLTSGRAMLRVLLSTVILCEAGMFVFFCLFSNTWKIRDVRRGEETKLYSAEPNVSDDMLFPMAITAFCGLAFDMLDFWQYLAIVIISGLCIATVLVLCAAPYDRKKSIGWAVILGLCFSFGTVSLVNCLWDPHAPVVHTSVVTDRYSRTGYKSGTSYYLEVQLSDGTTEQISVAGSLYRETEIGETVEVCEHEGLLDLAYVTLQRAE